MIIIVEGIDRIGKSTLCKGLSERINLPIYKEEGVHEKSQEGNMRSQMALLGLCKTTKCNVIFDRLFTSEFVYGIIDRQNNEFRAKEIFWKALNALTKIENVVYIGMNPTDVVRSSKEHGKDLTRHKKMFEDANKLIEQYIGEVKGNFVRINCVYSDIPSLIDEIENYVKEIGQWESLQPMKKK